MAVRKLFRVGLGGLPHEKDKIINTMFHYFVFFAARGRYTARASLELRFLFGGKTVAWVFCPIVVHENQNRRLVCVFIDQTWMERNGRPYFVARRRKNKRARERSGTKSTSTLTRTPPIDPYFVAIMIAMAQSIRQASPTGQEESVITVRLFTPSADRESLLLHTADVTPQFLGKFDFPYLRSAASLPITQEVIPMTCPTTHLMDILLRILNTSLPPHRGKRLGPPQEKKARSTGRTRGTKLKPLGDTTIQPAAGSPRPRRSKRKRTRLGS
ncbi:hypothetical protein BJ875DRAFT_477223 [Amylocarpus encephaloides]|uniref:Uncharacterized protein n=1 Tax=Amylocarpus encephaloides TaxID=45428 RepID=A0A9P7Y7J3_9HELO|nr:hypothetical protein BJ875DRAFT_477223 [Amylocarpus encephaloides]